jgi:hypothetical protein
VCGGGGAARWRPTLLYRAAAAQLPRRCGWLSGRCSAFKVPGSRLISDRPLATGQRLMDSNADWDELSLGTSRISFGENRLIKTPAETSRGQSALTRQHTDKARAPTWRPPTCSRQDSDKTRRRLGEDSEKTLRRLGEDSEKTRRRLGEDSENGCEQTRRSRRLGGGPRVACLQLRSRPKGRAVTVTKGRTVTGPGQQARPGLPGGALKLLTGAGGRRSGRPGPCQSPSQSTFTLPASLSLSLCSL